MAIVWQYGSNMDEERINSPNRLNGKAKFVGIESKAIETWSNDYLEQTKRDMNRYGIATAILSVLKPPRGAKVKGYERLRF